MNGAVNIRVIAVPQYEDTAGLLDTGCCDSDGLGEFVGLAHLAGVEPEWLRYLNPRSVQQFEADAGDDFPDGGHFAVSFHDRRNHRRPGHWASAWSGPAGRS
ncbi:MAG TPA: hypothetical protein VFQ44_23550 [Streptosporangiaceae bacterium]|nr:hypothetical protein [Streptosporangiaceae bacterium]